MTDSNPKPITPREWILEAETEYRFELDPGAILAVKVRILPRSDYNLIYVYQLVHGEAEVFGAELAEGKSYLFGSECKAAIFTWQGCTIEMSISLAVSLAYSYLDQSTSRVIPPLNMSQKRHPW
jgi:polyribonucleotide 5'-hydroxyl-kinase